MTGKDGEAQKLDSEQQALLMLRLRKRAALRTGQESPPDLKPRRQRSPTPLSFAQQRLLVIHQLDPKSPAYNMPAAVRIEGPLDTAAFERTLNEIIRRHETLRTTFEITAGEPVQIIAPAYEMSLPVLDLTALDAPEREGRLRQLRDEDARSPFNLSRLPLLRAQLLKLSAQEFVLLLTMHHIVSDGWSLSVFIGEIATLYEAFAAGRPTPLAELPIQYADFALWQREWLKGKVLEEQLSYWKRQLHDAPPLLEFPADRARPAVQSFRGARQTLELDMSLKRQLEELNRRERVTMFMTLLAALQVLLYRYAGEEDISVGTSVANRTRAELEGLIGFFVNTLVLRTKLNPAWSFNELLSHARETALGAYAHQDLPFERLVEELQPERARGHSPLFQVMFVLQNTPKSVLKLGNLTLSPLGGSADTSKFDMAWSVAEKVEGLSIGLEYNTDIFEAETIKRVLRHFRNVLEAVATNAEQTVASVPLIDAEERVRLLAEWNHADALPTESQRRLRDLLRAEDLINLDETAGTTSRAAPAAGVEDDPAQSVSLDRLVSGIQLYLLDSQLEPVPVGVRGRLYVGGARLGSAHLSTSESTAGRLIPHPFSSQPGLRLFDTGEVARRLPDGNIEIRRPSLQAVNLRRSELEREVEAILQLHPALSETLVVTRQDVEGESRIVAYVVGAGERPPSVAELDDFLKDRLAADMSPDAFVVLPALPAAGDGSVALDALPKPRRQETVAHETHLAPRDIIELQLAQIWEEILDVRPIGVRSNFFALGGNSLAALTLMIEIQEKFEQELPPDSLFQKATIESLATLLRNNEGSQPRSPLVRLQPNGSRRPFFCVHAIGGNVFPYLELSRSLGREQPFYAFQARGLNGEQEPYDSVEEMARYYVESLVEIQCTGPYLLGGWSFGGVVAFEMARQLRSSGHEIELLALFDSYAPGALPESLMHADNPAVLLADFLLDMGMMHGRRVHASYDEIAHLDVTEQMNYVMRRAQAAGLLPPHIGDEQLGHLLRVFKSNHQAFINYAPPLDYPGRINLFTAAASAHKEAREDATLGWGRVASENVEVTQVPGNHYTILGRPHVQVLAERLSRRLSTPKP